MDDEAIVIMIQIKNLMQSVGGIRKLAKETDALTQTERGLAKAAKHATDEMRKQRALSSGSASLSQTRALAKMFNNTGAQIRQQHAAYKMAAQSAVATARATSGAGIGSAAPLLAAEIASMENPITAVIAGMVAAAAAGVALAASAAQASVELAKMHFASGGTGEETAFLKILGKVGGQDLNQLAMDFSKEMTAGGPVAGMAGEYGIQPRGMWGPTDRAADLEKMIDAVRSMPEEKALRMAYASPTIQALMPYRLISDKTMGQIHNDARIERQVYTPQMGKDAADFMAQLARVGEAFNTLMGAIMKPLLPQLSKMFSDLADVFNNMALWVNSHQNVVKGVFDVLKGMFEMLFGMFDRGIKDFQKGIREFITPDKPGDRLPDALDRNTQAIEQNTMLYRNGTYGGGERARGAVPSKMLRGWEGWRGLDTERVTREAARLGAFVL